MPETPNPLPELLPNQKAALEAKKNPPVVKPKEKKKEMMYHITPAVKAVRASTSAAQRASSHFSEAPRIGTTTLRRGMTMKLNMEQMERMQIRIKVLHMAHAIDVTAVEPDGTKHVFNRESHLHPSFVPGPRHEAKDDPTRITQARKPPAPPAVPPLLPSQVKFREEAAKKAKTATPPQITKEEADKLAAAKVEAAEKAAAEEAAKKAADDLAQAEAAKAAEAAKVALATTQPMTPPVEGSTTPVKE